MGSLPAFFVAPLGILAGLFGVLFVGHWVTLVLGALGKTERAAPDQAARKPSKVGLILAVLHPAPWLLLVGVPYGAIQLIQHPVGPEWKWFIGSAVISMIVAGTFAAVTGGRAAGRSTKRVGTNANL
jgi:hypothetical protein